MRDVTRVVPRSSQRGESQLGKNEVLGKYHRNEYMYISRWYQVFRKAETHFRENVENFKSIKLLLGLGY